MCRQTTSQCHLIKISSIINILFFYVRNYFHLLFLSTSSNLCCYFSEQFSKRSVCICTVLCHSQLGCWYYAIVNYTQNGEYCMIMELQNEILAKERRTQFSCITLCHVIKIFKFKSTTARDINTAIISVVIEYLYYCILKQLLN